MASSSNIERSNVRTGRVHRTSHKERGSLLSRTEEDKSSHSSPLSQNKDQIKMKKKVIEKKATADVFIPSTVSVGTLARLLGVRLGKNVDHSFKTVIYEFRRTFATSDETSWYG